MKYKQVSAFTLMEMTVAMLVAALAIGITYSVFTLVMRSYRAQHDQSTHAAALLRLDELLKKDFDRSFRVVKSETGLDFIGDAITTHYEIYPNALIRNAGIVDTFRYSTISRLYLYEGNTVSFADTAKQGNLVDEFRLVLRYSSDSLALHYQKVYSSESLINIATNADH